MKRPAIEEEMKQPGERLFGENNHVMNSRIGDCQ